MAQQKALRREMNIARETAKRANEIQRTIKTDKDFRIMAKKNNLEIKGVPLNLLDLVIKVFIYSKIQ